MPMAADARDKVSDDNSICLGKEFRPSKWDVICHKGRESYDHVGNRRFRLCIDNNLVNYVNAKTKLEKSQIVRNIVDSIRENCRETGGGFVKQDSTGKWYEIGDKAREKVSQALRDAHKSEVAARADATVNQDAKVYERLYTDAARSNLEAMPSSATLPSRLFKLSPEPNDQSESLPQPAPLPAHGRKSRKRPASLPMKVDDSRDSQRARLREEASDIHETKVPTKKVAARIPGRNDSARSSIGAPAVPGDPGKQQASLSAAAAAIFGSISANEQVANRSSNGLDSLEERISYISNQWPVLPIEAEPDLFPPLPHRNLFLDSSTDRTGNQIRIGHAGNQIRTGHAENVGEPSLEKGDEDPPTGRKS